MSDGRACFALNAALEPEALAKRFAERGRIQIMDFLDPPAATMLHDHLARHPDWRHVINSGTKVFETESASIEAMRREERETLDKAIMTAAVQGFQFRYDTIRIADEPEERGRSATLLDDFASFMSSPETLEFIRRITGRSEIVFADAQATRYRSGDFLTRHDDNVAEKNRSLAYVMAVSRDWRPEWGGLLLFNDADGNVIDTIVPRFNALSLFTVPQPHSVSYVAPYAGGVRLSVTGWLRSMAP